MTAKITFYLHFIFLTLACLRAQADHPIFILLTHPRATGTAFERVMRTQESMQVLHSPYLDPYLIKKYGPGHSFTSSLPNQSLTFEDITHELFKMAKQSPVFFKESGYLLVDYFKEHPEFYTHPQVKFAFLVRDPAKSIISFYKKMPTVDESIIGHRQLWELFSLLKDKKHEIPLVIDSDEFLKNPLHILNKLGKSWELKFNENNLHWESGYAADWHLKEWYIEVANSTELGPYKDDILRDLDGVPYYWEVTNEQDRLKLQNLYRIQNIYYQQLLQYAIKD